MEQSAMHLEAPVTGSDSDLVGRARDRDAGAWRSIIRAHREPVFRLALLLTGDTDAAADVAQETFIRAYRYLDRFDARRSLRPWLLRITRSQAGNFRRGAARYLRTLLQFASEPASIESCWQPPGDLWRAVRRLGDGARQVIYLRYFLDLSEAETAEVLGVAPGTVKSRHARALARLNDIIRKDFPDLQPEGGGHD